MGKVYWTVFRRDITQQLHTIQGFEVGTGVIDTDATNSAKTAAALPDGDYVRISLTEPGFIKIGKFEDVVANKTNSGMYEGSTNPNWFDFASGDGIAVIDLA